MDEHQTFLQKGGIADRHTDLYNSVEGRDCTAGFLSVQCIVRSNVVALHAVDSLPRCAAGKTPRGRQSLLSAETSR